MKQFVTWQSTVNRDSIHSTKVQRCKLTHPKEWQHTHTRLFYGSVDFVRDNPGEPVPEETFTHSHLSAFSIYYNPWHPPYSVFFHNLQVFFGLPLGLAPFTSYSIHFFTQSLSSFRHTCAYHRNLFHCSTEIMSSKPSLPLNSLLGTLSCNFTPHIHLTILISALWSATSFSFVTGQVSLPCNILLHTQLLYNLPLTVNDISLLVSNGTRCLNLFYPIRILLSTVASASPSTLNMSPTPWVKKRRQYTLVHIFAKYWPIVIILSPTHSLGNLQ